MPRRREVTLDRLEFAWNADGSAASARSSGRTRPMAHELGRVLLALVDAESAASSAHTARHGAPCALTITEVARWAALSEQEARWALHELLPTGCVARQRVPLGRQRACARWAHGFHLVAERETHGPGRRPRLSQLALVIEPSVACGDMMDVLLRRAGVLTAQVLTSADAHRLLARVGFEFLLADAAVASEPPGLATLVQMARAAGCGPLILMRGANADAPRTVDVHAAPLAVGFGATVARNTHDHKPGGHAGHATDRIAMFRKPFSPEAFDATIQRLMLGFPLAAGDDTGALLARTDV